MQPQPDQVNSLRNMIFTVAMVMYLADCVDASNTFSSFFMNNIYDLHADLCSGSGSVVLNPIDTRMVLLTLHMCH